MQIEVVDDASEKEDLSEVVTRVGQGRITYYRQPVNVGATANFNACVRRSFGEWVHILHGDDLVRPTFYDTLRSSLEKAPSVGAAFCRMVFVDEDSDWLFLSPIERKTPGVLEHWSERISEGQQIQFPAMVVKRSAYEHLGGFDPRLIHAADWEMWQRLAANYPIWFQPELLACYRLHQASDTSMLVRSGRNIADSRIAVEISASHYPAERRAAIKRRALRNLALMAQGRANSLSVAGDYEAAFNQLCESVKCAINPSVLRCALRVFARYVMRFPKVSVIYRATTPRNT